MLTFLVQEGIITIGAISGIFTALLMNSFKNNIIDPVVEKVAPLDKLLDFVDDGKINNSHKKTGTPQKPEANNLQGILPQAHGNQFGGVGKDTIKWKVFLRDFITWAIIIIILYHVWKRIIQPIKTRLSQNLPTQTPANILSMGKIKIKR